MNNWIKIKKRKTKFDWNAKFLTRLCIITWMPVFVHARACTRNIRHKVQLNWLIICVVNSDDRTILIAARCIHLSDLSKFGRAIDRSDRIGLHRIDWSCYWSFSMGFVLHCKQLGCSFSRLLSWFMIHYSFGHDQMKLFANLYTHCKTIAKIFPIASWIGRSNYWYCYFCCCCCCYCVACCEWNHAYKSHSLSLPLWLCVRHTIWWLYSIIRTKHWYVWRVVAFASQQFSNFLNWKIANAWLIWWFHRNLCKILKMTKKCYGTCLLHCSKRMENKKRSWWWEINQMSIKPFP